MELNPYDVTEEDFICIVYYVEPYKIKVKIYRIDKPTGWTQDLNLCIENSEIIHIGSSIDNLLVKEYQIKTLVHLKSYSSIKIPKIIIQTGYWQKDNIQAWNTTQSFLDYNPDFLYLFYDNLDCISFFQKWCPDDLKYYLKSIDLKMILAIRIQLFFFHFVFLLFHLHHIHHFHLKFC